MLLDLYATIYHINIIISDDDPAVECFVKLQCMVDFCRLNKANFMRLFSPLTHNMHVPYVRLIRKREN